MPCWLSPSDAPTPTNTLLNAMSQRESLIVNEILSSVNDPMDVDEVEATVKSIVIERSDFSSAVNVSMRGVSGDIRILKWSGTSYEYLVDIAENPVVEEVIIDDLLPHVTIHGHRGAFITADAQAFEHSFAEFTNTTGIRVRYIPDPIFETTINEKMMDSDTSVLPDIALFQIPGQLTENYQYMKKINDITDLNMSVLDSEFSPYLMKLGSVGVDMYVVS